MGLVGKGEDNGCFFYMYFQFFNGFIFGEKQRFKSFLLCGTGVGYMFYFKSGKEQRGGIGLGDSYKV